jgi:glutamate formiminotransferase/glutamate formiminotransferase/formiminotetrahydrofolate cyclodeaminase
MPPPLLAVPNISEGRDLETVHAIGEAFDAAGARLLDVHRDADHHRSVFTLAGAPGKLSEALLAGFEVAVRRVDISDGRGQHPHVGAIDVAPIVHLDELSRGAACAEALLLGDLIGERLQVPVLIYGELAGGRIRAALRRGGPLALARRIESGELTPDFGPHQLHPSAGATLLAARSPLVAFNLELAAPADLATAREIAAAIREGGREGLPGVRAIGIALQGPEGEVGQVSCNVERPYQTPLRLLVEVVSRHAEVRRTELVGLAPAAAFEGFPEEVPIPGFDPARHLLENALGL